MNFLIGLLHVVIIGSIVVSIALSILKRIQYNKIIYGVRTGMTEAEILSKYGRPSKALIIDSHTKLLSYSIYYWNGLLFGGTKYREITFVIKDGKVFDTSAS